MFFFLPLDHEARIDKTNPTNSNSKKPEKPIIPDTLNQTPNSESNNENHNIIPNPNQENIIPDPDLNSKVVTTIDNKNVSDRRHNTRLRKLEEFSTGFNFNSPTTNILKAIERQQNLSIQQNNLNSNVSTTARQLKITEFTQSSQSKPGN